MADIFISYAREDEVRIQPLVRVLETRAWSIFWDRQIPAGQTWRSYIGKALGDARCVIVAWSRDSIVSDWVSEEADVGKKRGILIPVLLDAVEPPIGFRSIQAADLTDWQSDRLSPHFEKLLHEIRGVLQATPTPPPTLAPPPSCLGRRVPRKLQNFCCSVFYCSWHWSRAGRSPFGGGAPDTPPHRNPRQRSHRHQPRSSPPHRAQWPPRSHPPQYRRPVSHRQT
jgi:TIR domain-containing protein